jgi:hypothetical protein
VTYLPSNKALVGSVRLEPGTRYRVIAEFKDYDSKVHTIGEEWIFRGYDVFPYDDGHSLFVEFGSGEQDVIRLQWHAEGQAHILESFGEYVMQAQRAFAGDARNARA